VELKIRLQSRADLDRLEATLLSWPAAICLGCARQDDLFLDGPARPLLREKTVFRLRSLSAIEPSRATLSSAATYAGDAARHVATLKVGSHVSAAGVMIAGEEECAVPPACAAALRSRPADPTAWRGAGCPLADRVADRLVAASAAAPALGSQGGLADASDPAALVPIGGYSTVRCAFRLPDAGLTVEVDETTYGFGTAYEVEVETTDIPRAQEV
ncbi:hypothetical protein HK405_014334, partial [Cladochytrium tenue]